MQPTTHQSQHYKINIDSRAYDKWGCFEQNTFTQVDLIHINPINHKLFSDDVFTLNDNSNNINSNSNNNNKQITIVHSSTRINQYIPAVLVLNNNKTYGRLKDKLLYKCLPDDSRIPAFLIPYTIKNVGFSKVFPNIYVTIQFTSWGDNDKHPFGAITQTIGDVNVLDNFYEYQLYCKSLNHSIQKFTKQAHLSVNLYTKSPMSTHDCGGVSNDQIIHNICSKYADIEDRTRSSVDELTAHHIFTIDPFGSTDFDDACSIRKSVGDCLRSGCASDIFIISVYISNVPILIDALNLWSSFSQRISTIYLPDKKRPMLPTILSDGLCSLQENKDRVAFTMDLSIDAATGEIIAVRFRNCKIRVTKNYVYEEPALKKCPDYLMLMNCVQMLSQKYKYVNNIRNSHELIAYLMIIMNYQCAKHMMPYNNGIFRTVTIKQEPVEAPTAPTAEQADAQTTVPSASEQNIVPVDVDNFIKFWKSSCGQYVNIENNAINNNNKRNLTHSMLELDAYIHITSPIRRLVDILNMIQFQQNMNMLRLEEEASSFYINWVSKLDYINTTTRAIRKVQSDCSFLSMCSKQSELLLKEYEGYCFDKIERNDGLYQYNVYLTELKLAYRITTRENMSNCDKRQYKLFLFNNEDNFKKKMRLHLI